MAPPRRTAPRRLADRLRHRMRGLASGMRSWRPGWLRAGGLAPPAPHTRRRAVARGAGGGRPLAGERARVTLHWELRGPDGSAAGTYDQTTESSTARWRAGEATLLKELVGAAAPAIAEM